ncbi:putative glutamate-5-semialdehyde dehydrogenase, Glutamate 5-kinase [Helianthus annuus]|nr:putative glutamate-5-semialdehyde dehydrogenase, Glutamate 5-kinase [Helianthus annuus]
MFSGVSINGGPRVCSLLNLRAAQSFHHENNSLNCTMEIVDDVHAAVEHIHKHGRQVLFNSFWYQRACTLAVSRCVVYTGQRCRLRVYEIATLKIKLILFGNHENPVNLWTLPITLLN